MSLQVKRVPTAQKETIGHMKTQEKKHHAYDNGHTSNPTQILAKAKPQRFKLIIRSSRNNIYN